MTYHVRMQFTPDGPAVEGTWANPDTALDRYRVGRQPRGLPGVKISLPRKPTTVVCKRSEHGRRNRENKPLHPCHPQPLTAPTPTPRMSGERQLAQPTHVIEDGPKVRGVVSG